MVFPHSIGLLYSAFTAFLGFEVNEGEYKVMGMAPYGQPRYMDKVWKLIRQESDGSFSLDMDYFCFQHSTDRTFNNRFVQLFGDPRPPKMLFFTKESGFPTYFGEPPSNFAELCKLNQHYADIASSIQQVTEEVLLGMARAVHKETGRSGYASPAASVSIASPISASCGRLLLRSCSSSPRRETAAVRWELPCGPTTCCWEIPGDFA